jgi:excinuclease ABC subunit C
MTPLHQKLEHLPTHPGVYLFKDTRGTVLYVGKAGNLRHRVNSYFQRANGKMPRRSPLLERVADIETIITDTEKALMEKPSSRNIIRGTT